MARTKKWLDEREQHAWRAFLLTSRLLEEALDRQLQRDAGLAHTHYGILVGLSEAPGHTLRMNDLASQQRFSQSRLTHAIARLERDGYVERRQCESDRRGQLAVLTPAGMAALRAAAPGHVAEVRRRVFDHLTDEQVDALIDLCETLLPGLDPPVACPSRDGAAAAPAPA
ncbi:MAG TPA: MarR family transcriptional regulator [Acidimicrobiales bacterium]|nr:MarR family transcriptional regulator [Acidimicrobiales bacterium]